MNKKTFIACDTNNISKVKKIIKLTQTKKLKIGYFTSGNELIDPSEKLEGSKINNSNRYSLQSLLNDSYIVSNYLGILTDSKDKIIESLNVWLGKKNKVEVVICDHIEINNMFEVRKYIHPGEMPNIPFFIRNSISNKINFDFI